MKNLDEVSGWDDVDAVGVPTEAGATEYGALVRDARRYRWLRSLDGRCDAAACVSFNIGFDWIEQHGEELDAAIDAAMEVK